MVPNLKRHLSGVSEKVTELQGIEGIQAINTKYRDKQNLKFGAVSSIILELGKDLGLI